MKLDTSNSDPSRGSQVAELRFVDVTKEFPSSAHGGSMVAIEDIGFSVNAGEFVALVGPSGCGKSTLLNVTAGLMPPTGGDILIDGVAVEDRRPYFGYMFQSDLLMPWADIRKNVALGLEILGTPRREARDRAMEILREFELDQFADKYPIQLSGGMRQRVAFMRTLLCNRPVLLLDEPFGALDALTRSVMQEWLLGVWERTKPTIILITHDVEEAIFLADRVLMMTARPGRIGKEVSVDLGRPRDHSVLTTPEFNVIKEEILEELFREVARSRNGDE
ncbi:MAG: ABC transporter ATP-binding protein [Acidimicrobiaceae bacterium]|nr:ABC transporter ATP-binding protein [Acidimicrobiaceae bacterium]